MKFLKQLSVLLFCVATFAACDEDKINELTEGAVININTDVLNSVLSVSFENAFSESDAEPNISLAVSGPDAEDIFTPAGSKTFTTDDRLVDFAIRKTLEPTSDNPIVFDLTASAPGFETKTVRLRITDVNEIQSATIYLTPQNTISASAGYVDATSTVTAADGTSETISVTAEADRSMTAMLPEGTILYDENGDAITGTATYELSFYDGSDADHFRAFPTSLTNASLTDTDGNVLTDRQLTVFGYYEATLRRGGLQQVRTMSQPMDIQMEIPANIYNLGAEETVEEGDMIPVYSLNESTNVWEYESMAMVGMENGQLVANFEQTHFSIWALMFGFNFDDLSISARATIESGLDRTASSPGRGWQLEYVDGTLIYLAGSVNEQYRFYDGQVIDLNVSGAQPLLLQNVVLKVYEGPASCRGELLATSAPFFPLSTNLEINLSELQPDPDAVEIDIKVNGLCDNDSGADFRIFPSGTIHYRPTNCPTYQLLGEVNDGKFNTKALRRGATYDFLGKYNGTSFEYENVLIESGSFDFSGQTLRVTVDGELITIEYIDVPLDSEYCDLFG